MCARTPHTRTRARRPPRKHRSGAGGARQITPARPHTHTRSPQAPHGYPSPSALASGPPSASRACAPGPLCVMKPAAGRLRRKRAYASAACRHGDRERAGHEGAAAAADSPPPHQPRLAAIRGRRLLGRIEGADELRRAPRRCARTIRTQGLSGAFGFAPRSAHTDRSPDREAQGLCSGRRLAPSP